LNVLSHKKLDIDRFVTVYDFSKPFLRDIDRFYKGFNNLRKQGVKLKQKTSKS